MCVGYQKTNLCHFFASERRLSATSYDTTAEIVRVAVNCATELKASEYITFTLSILYNFTKKESFFQELYYIVTNLRNLYFFQPL